LGAIDGAQANKRRQATVEAIPKGVKRSCFAFSMKELGALIGPGIHIELANDTLIFHRPYRYSDMERDLIRSRTLDLLEAGLVELSHGEYASAIVVSAKKDVHGNYTDRRMCGDYHLINR
jgi:hypothetical protein